jgi:DNA modification methylase
MEFFKGDCLEVMKTLPNKSIDCFVCDLPYGCLNNKWDNKIDLVKFWEQIKRLAKDDHTPILMFCTTKFGAELIASNSSWFRYDLVWNKNKGVGFLSANKQPLRSHEMIYVFSKKGAYYKRVDIEGDFPRSHSRGYTTIGNTNTYNGGKPLVFAEEVDNTGKRCVKSIVETVNKKGKGNHPTQKPEELYEWLLKRYCSEGGTILDPTAGSFTSCFTANKLGLKSIGIEMNDEFFEKAIKVKDGNYK